jgi:hypothetical protein
MSGSSLLLVERLVAADGSKGHYWPHRLGSDRASWRDLADAVHAMCMLHGGQPGMADDASSRGVQGEASEWLGSLAAGFAGERAALAALVAAAGRLPSTPGHAESEAAILTQRHALEMLARSDRRGCASGAVAALALDWPAIRCVLDRAADVFGVTIAPSSLPAPADTIATLALLGASPACERAIGFGAQQFLAQHRGLWGLLEARAEARG